MRQTLRALMLGVSLIALMASCLGAALLREIQAPYSSDATPVTFVVEPGQTTDEIANNLARAELIRNPLLFRTLVRFRDLDAALQSGTFQLRPNMTMSEIMVALQNATSVAEVQITIPEGLRLEEIAELMGQSGLPEVSAEEFLRVARNGAAFKPTHFLLGSLPDGASLEGYLFPDTYRFFVTSSVTDTLEVMLTRFDQQYDTFQREVQVEASVHEIVTMASIVQREAAVIDEMPQIAAVFWNRLKPENIGETGDGRLQADPTVQYALGQPGNWWPRLEETLTLDEINAVDSPYNTRARPGLPPGPIAAPGLAALTAAARPDSSANYLYFVLSCEGNGRHNFATTFEEFQRFEQEYLACLPN